jgi:predicted transcriptional regulator
MFTVRLTEDLEARLSEITKKSGCSKSAFTRDAVARFITKWEGELLTEKLRASGEPTFKA